MPDPAFSYSALPGRNQGTTILKITGPLTLNTLFSFQDAFREMKPPVLILDLAQSPYMDSAGLGLVLNKYVSAENGKRKFLLAGVSPRIHALLELTKVAGILRLYLTADEAEAAAWYQEGVLRR